MRALAIVLAVGLLCGTARAQSPSAAPRTAARIVSLVPSVTEMLFAIGAGPRVVAVSSFDHFPAEVEALPKVGALLDPDTERVLSLQPDLVVTYGSQTDLEVALKRAGIRTYTYRHGGVEGTLRTIAELGPLTGTETAARAVVRRVRAQLYGVKQRVAGRPRPRTLLAFGHEPGTLRALYVAGGVGFMHDLLELAGAVNLFGDIRRESVQPSQEQLLVRKPDVVLEVRGVSDATDARALLRPWSVLASVPAVRNGRVHALTGAYLVVPGPRLGEAAEAIARVIHPGAF